MARKNTTHLSRLARTISDATDLSYAQALARCHQAADAGTLPHPLDESGMAVAATRLIAVVNATPAGPAAVVATCLGVSADGPVTLSARELAGHTLVVGESPDRDAAACALADIALELGWGVRVVDLAPEPGAKRRWRALAARRAVPWHGPSGERVDFSLPGVTWTPAPGTGGSGRDAGATLALAAVLDAFAVRVTDPVPARAMLVLNGVDDLDVTQVANVISRARGAGVAGVVTCAQVPSDFEEVERLTRNIGAFLAFRPRTAEAAGVVSLHQHPGTDTSADLLALDEGTGLLRTEGHPLRQVKVAPCK